MIQLQKDKFLGSGAFKTVYQIAPDMVAAVVAFCYCFRCGGEDAHHQSARRELRLLKKLKSLGFRVPRYLGLRLVRTEAGARRYALVMEKLCPLPKNMTKQIRADLMGIRKRAKKLDVCIHDFQFLLDKNGRVVLTDPQDVVVGSKDEACVDFRYEPIGTVYRQSNNYNVYVPQQNPKDSP